LVKKLRIVDNNYLCENVVIISFYYGNDNMGLESVVGIVLIGLLELIVV